MNFKKMGLVAASCAVAVACFGNPEYRLAKPQQLLLAENFDQAELPKLFTVGTGDWKIVDGTLRGRELAASKHTAFRKIALNHQDVIYEYDMKLEGKAYTQLLINWDLVHIAKAVIRYDSAVIFKVLEQKKREEMVAGGRDQGRDPLKGNWNEATTALDQAALKLEAGRWYHVVVEVVGDTLSLQIDGHTVVGKHVGLTEKKDNFGFQAGGLEGFVYFDNIKIWSAAPAQR